jgi:hypothetical protein
VSISQFIKDNYTVLFKGDQVDLNKLEEVENFILADDHGSLGTQRLHSLFVNSYFNDRGCKVYAESNALGTLLDERAKELLWLNTDLIVEGWDLGTIEQIFAKGIQSIAQTKDLKIDEVTKLFNTLEISKNNLNQYRTSLKKFLDSDKKTKSKEIAKKELKKIIIEGEKIRFNNQLLFQIVDSTFIERQISLLTALNQKGRKAVVVGEQHVYKEKENSKGLFDNDPNLTHGEIGRFFIQSYVKQTNAVILQPKPEAVSYYFQTDFAALIAETAKLYVDESEDHSNDQYF